ncbi:MAG: hypothetical protein OEY14_17720 [Myxococcales bacterium]|nr:hypothetical protein [Myxococcales bacterium]
MDRLPGATTLARALLALARARATGILELRACRHSARISLVEGFARAAQLDEPDDDSLGDLLYRAGDFDLEAHGEALIRGPALGLVGEWLIDAKATTRPALVAALRRQLEGRIRRLFRWQGLELRFLPGPARIDTPWVQEPVPTAELVLRAMRELVAEEPLGLARRSLGEGLLRLTPLGEPIVQGAALWPEEAALLPLLRRGAPVEHLLSASGGRPRGIRGLRALYLLRAVAAPRAEGRSYRALARKRSQLRHSADPRTLLELSPRSPRGDARRSLRQMARDLHPDHFPEPRLQRASGEVFKALVEAEARIRVD